MELVVLLQYLYQRQQQYVVWDFSSSSTVLLAVSLEAFLNQLDNEYLNPLYSLHAVTTGWNWSKVILLLIMPWILQATV